MPTTILSFVHMAFHYPRRTRFGPSLALNERPNPGHGSPRYRRKFHSFVAPFARGLTDIFRAPRRRGPDATESLSAPRAPLLPLPWRGWVVSLVAASYEELAEGSEGGHDDADLCGHDFPKGRPRHIDLVVRAHPRGSDDGDDDHDNGQAE